MMFGVSPPWNREDPVEHIAFNGFAIETEMREEQINLFIHLLVQTEDPNNYETQMAVFNHVQLDPFSLTPMEKLRIESEVARRL